MKELKKLIIICGHYGSGKTNFTVNLALDIASKNNRVLVTDLDIVNPYFRSSDFLSLFQEHKIELVAPVFAGTTVDAPQISASVTRAFSFDGYSIIDLGGDPVGATAIGQYFSSIKDIDYDMLYVINQHRAESKNPEDAYEILQDIEKASRLKATYLVNNSHLQEFTNLDMIKQSESYAKKVSRLSGLDLWATTVNRELLEKEDGDISNIPSPYIIDIYVKKPWEQYKEGYNG